MNLLNGKDVSLAIIEELLIEIQELKKINITPTLAVIVVGNDPASKIYVANKEKKCIELGLKFIKYELPETTDEIKILNIIDELNAKKEIHGILVQLPLPKHINEHKIINSIDPSKDVDGFHLINKGKLVIGKADLIPCTALGIIETLKFYEIKIEGEHVVIVGRSNIVGKPASCLFLNENATVTVCHSRTKNLSKITEEADILVVAVGIPRFIKDDMVNKNAVVIDVGINRMPNGTIVGDVDFENVKDKVRAITPVPGGVGIMTVVTLIKNTITAAQKIGG